MDFATLIAAVDLTTVGAAILAIAALQAVPTVVQWGTRKVMGMLKRG